jgi:hypothetical protein
MISPEIWEAINRVIPGYGRRDIKVEKGKQSRIDCTAVSSNIHEPTDASLLWDSARVITKDSLEEIILLAEKIIDQTVRRVINNEAVPSTEKIVSVFEPHTDIIKKDKRVVFYGHRICLIGGSSNLITDSLILGGNPADSDLTGQMLDRHKAKRYIWILSQ